MIDRNKYVNKLVNSMNNGMIKVITGIRRCGKTYLLFELFYNYLIENNIDKDHIIKIAFDDIAYEELLEPHNLYNFIKQSIKDTNNYYLLLDEVQYIQNFEYVLNSFLHISNLDVYVTGSNARFLSKDVITEFRGRGYQIHLQPLSFKEFYSTLNLNKEEAWNEYITYGGLPKTISFKTHIEKANYLTSIFKETYIKDIVDRNNIKNDLELEELIDIVSSSIGRYLNPQKISNTFKSEKHISIHQETIKNYLNYLEDSFLISQVKRFDIKGRKYINTPFKYYFTDIGLRNSRLNFRQLEETHLMENVIYNELIARGYSVDIGEISINEKNNKNMFEQKKTEIDFICNNIDKKYYIQCALTMPTIEKIKQESRPLLKINDSFKKIIIVKDTFRTHYTEDGILILNLFDFLLDENSINY